MALALASLAAALGGDPALAMTIIDSYIDSQAGMTAARRATRWCAIRTSARSAPRDPHRAIRTARSAHSTNIAAMSSNTKPKKAAKR